MNVNPKACAAFLFWGLVIAITTVAVVGALCQRWFWYSMAVIGIMATVGVLVEMLTLGSPGESPAIPLEKVPTESLRGNPSGPR